MSSKTSVAVLTGLVLAGVLVLEPPRLIAATAPTSQGEGTTQGNADWGKINVELPTSAKLFPSGDGSAIANSQCLICHSAGMVLLQPARTQEQWKETINKMRSAYGAPLPAEQVNALAAYLTRVIGVETGDRHTPTVD
jgi:mono/diheme cytochrome c family protein